MMKKNRSSDPRYQRMSLVEVRDGELLVTFEDGSRVELALDQLLPPGTQSPAWNSIRFDPYEIVVPTSSGEIEIPWTTIRLLSDPAFAKMWTESEQKQIVEVGLRLRELRRQRNLTSKEVAERAGITPQSLSRIEKGHHDVTFDTLSGVLAAMRYSLRDLAETKVSPVSLTDLLKRLERLGIKREWILDRLLPRELLSRLNDPQNDVDDALSEAAKFIGRIYGWSPDSVLSSATLAFDPAIINTAKFKVQNKTQEIQATAYTVYAHYLALLVLHASQHLPSAKSPKSADEMRQAIIAKYRVLSFETFTRYSWDIGIPILPLFDSGSFHGACWRESDRSIIVLKQVTPYQARWLFDGLHEHGHVAKHLTKDRTSFIEPEEISPFAREHEEREASEFASRVILEGREEEITDRCVEVAKGKVEYLKSAVFQVAAAEHVPVDVLANYVAYRLALQSINWWGAANNLQITDPAPAQIAREVLLQKIKMERLSAEDQGILLRALGIGG